MGRRYLGWLAVGAMLAATSAAAQHDRRRPVPMIQICGAPYDARDERAVSSALRACGIQNVRVSMQDRGTIMIQFNVADIPMIGIGPGPRPH